MDNYYKINCKGLKKGNLSMSIKMKNLPNSEKPYEKLEMYGAENLSNSELLAIIIKTGTKEDSSINIAQKILAMKGNYPDNLRFLQDVSIEELKEIKGIGRVKAIQIKALCELTKRMSRNVHENHIYIKTPKDVVNLLMEEMKYEKIENVKVIILNIKNAVQKIINISTGTTNSALIIPKDILREAVKMGMPKIILVHNHPSGDATPSKEDVEITKRVKEASNIMGIDLLDHIVIGFNCYTSIFQKYSIGD